MILLSDTPGARFEVTFGGNDAFREPMVVDAAEFIGTKSFKAKGKRLTTFVIGEIREIEPNAAAADSEDDSSAMIADAAEGEEEDRAASGEEALSDDELRDEINGQQRIF